MKNNKKNKIQFKTNSTQLSDDKIAKHKNFNKLMHEYQDATKPLYKTPLYKNKKVFLVVLIILLVSYMIYEGYQKSETKNTPTPTEDVR